MTASALEMFTFRTPESGTATMKHLQAVLAQKIGHALTMDDVRVFLRGGVIPVVVYESSKPVGFVFFTKMEKYLVLKDAYTIEPRRRKGAVKEAFYFVADLAHDQRKRGAYIPDADGPILQLARKMKANPKLSGEVKESGRPIPRYDVGISRGRQVVIRRHVPRRPR